MIGVDVDSKGLRFLMAYYNAIALFGKDKVRVYETRKGYHIYIDVDLPPEKAFTIRRYLGDDPDRLYFDQLRTERLGRYHDTLFMKKYYRGKLQSVERELKL